VGHARARERARRSFLVDARGELPDARRGERIGQGCELFVHEKLWLHHQAQGEQMLLYG